MDFAEQKSGNGRGTFRIAKFRRLLIIFRKDRAFPPSEFLMITETVTIDSIHGGKPIGAYLSRPDTPGNGPALIVIHEWWGLVPHIKDVADRYASQGYVTVAPDLYGGAVGTSPEEASKLSSSVTPEISKKMLDSVVSYLSSVKFVNPERIGITGFCFGGTHSFNYLCESDRIAAGVLFYATQPVRAEEKLAKITAPVLIIYGDQDYRVKQEVAREIEGKLKRLGKNAQLVIYPGCGHAFFNDQNKQAYRPEASRDAWEKTLAFFAKYLKP